ncbi:MAG TPA: nucleotidyltransferase family protein [Acidobacteriaceae bacterium]
MPAHTIGNGVLTARIPREFAALMEALQVPAPSTDALLELNDSGWRKLLDVCDSAHLTLSLAQVPFAGFPGWVVERLQRNVADNARRWRRVQALYTEAADALWRARVPHVVIKGFTLAPDYVKDPRFRVQSDVDFYVPPYHIDKAVAALEAIGFSHVCDGNFALADHVPTLVRPGGEWKGNLYDPDLALGIEFHFCLWNSVISRISFPETEAFWRRRVARRFGDFQFWSLRDIDQLGYFALHILRDVFRSDCIVHHVLELARFLDLHAHDTAFWNQWQKLHKPRLRQAQAVAFLLAHRWFSARLSDEAHDETARLPDRLTRWVESLGGCPLEASYRRTREGRLLQFLLADSWDAKLYALRHALLPSVFTMPSRAELCMRPGREGRGGLSPAFDKFAWLARRLMAQVQVDARFLMNGVGFWLTRSTPPAESQLLRSPDGMEPQYAVDGSGR